MGWTCLSTYCQTKFQLEDPGSLDHPTLGLTLQAITGHNYLNYYHNITGNISAGRNMSLFTLLVSALHLPRYAWTLSGGTSLIDNLLTYMDLSGSQKWTSLARPWIGGQNKLS